MVDLSAGTCVGHSLAAWWISDDLDERRAAAAICRSGPCPVIRECGEWAISMAVANGTPVFGGMLTAELRERRSAWLRAKRVAERTSAVSRNPGALNAALDELRRDPARSDRLVAGAAGVDPATVCRARALDPSALAPQARTSRPKPPRTSEVRDLILAGATTREITRQAGVTRQAVWRMKRRLAA